MSKMRNILILFLIISLISSIISGCKYMDLKKTNTEKGNEESFEVYLNNAYGFELQLPSKILNSHHFEVRENKEKYTDAISLEFIYGEATPDNVYTGGMLFEIVVNKVSSEKVIGEVLTKDNKYIYGFRPETEEIDTAEEEIENATFKEIFQGYKAFFPQIKDSFIIKK